MLITPEHIDARRITDFPDYMVTESGVILRNDNIIFQQANQHGYLKVALWKQGKRYIRLVHRLVAAHFPDVRNITGLYIHHWDGNRQNNHYTNLFVADLSTHVLLHSDRFEPDPDDLWI